MISPCSNAPANASARPPRPTRGTQRNLSLTLSQSSISHPPPDRASLLDICITKLQCMNRAPELRKSVLIFNTMRVLQQVRSESICLVPQNSLSSSPASSDGEEEEPGAVYLSYEMLHSRQQQQACKDEDGMLLMNEEEVIAALGLTDVVSAIMAD